MKTILFVPCYDGHIRVFAPVIKRLEGQGELEPLVVFLEGKHGAKLLEFLTEHSLPYTRVDLSSYPAAGGKQGFIQRARNALSYTRFLLSRKREVSKLFDKLNPAFVVTVTDGFQTDAYFLYEAKKRGIPSLCLYSVMTSVVSTEERRKRKRSSLLNTFYLKVLLFLGLPVHGIPAPSRGYATKVAVWSEKHKEAVLQRGGNAEKMVITGSPAHDLIYQKLYEQSKQTKIKVHRLLDIEEDKQIILFTSQPWAIERFCTFEEQRHLTELIVETCAQFSDCTLVIKLHPRQSVEEYIYLNDHPLKNRFRLVTEKDADLYDLILVAKVLITQTSTTGLEAMLFNKDVVVMDLFLPFKDVMSYVKSGAALGVYREDELLDTLCKILKDERTQRELKSNREKFTAEYTYKFDGRSADRVIELISEMLK